MTDNDTSLNGDTFEPKSGYDIPVYGLANGSFYSIHIPALVCIVAGFICASIAITLSFRRKGCGTFYKSWSKSEKFVVYLAICDGLFNVSHFTDHLHIVIARDMVHPKELCEFYAFNLTVFITAQNFMVNIIAINAFMLIYFDKNINFGRNDWKLLVWTFGVPLVGATVAGAAGQFGPNGAFCYFDEVKGRIAKIFFTSIPLVLILVVNTILYILIWNQINKQTREIKRNLGSMSASTRASHKAVRAMSLFVAAFLIQWWPMTVYGIWNLVDSDVPQSIVHIVTTFSNIGGVLNLIVYLVIRRRQLFRDNPERNVTWRQ